MMRITIARLVFGLLTLFLAGCSAFGFEIPRLLQAATPTPTEAAAIFSTPSPTSGQPTATIAATQPGPRQINVWLPPAFDPDQDSVAARTLQAQIEAFEAEHPGVDVIVRVKAPSGPGGLFESLAAASAAAPGAMPALVALSRSDLEVAALKGLVQPMDGLVDMQGDSDWYDYARSLGKIQGATFGVPFGGDALLMLFRPARLGPPPAGWDAVMQLGQPLVFAAADPQGLFTLLLYQGLGGAVEDDERRPLLEQEALVNALTLYDSGAQQGVFPYWLSNIQSDNQAWQAYRDQRAQLLVTWSSSYFDELPADSTIMTLPAMGEQPFTLATGWVWALSEPNPTQQELAAQLAETLSAPDFLTSWGAKVGLLPVRPSGLAGWTDETVRKVLAETAQAARLRPGNDLMTSLSPALEAATLAVIKRESDPNEAARSAVERLASLGVK